MKKWIVGLTVAAMAMLSVPAFADDAPAPAASASTASTGTGNAYNYSIPATAGASCCGGYYDHDNANGNAVIVMTNFNQKLAAMQLAIIEAMRLSTGQLSGNMREQTGADHTLADQQDDRATVKAVEEARLQAIRDAESGASSCRVISGGRGGGMTAERNKYVAKVMRSMGAWERGEAGPSEQGQSAGMLARLEMHCQMFASPADIAAKICTNTNTTALPAADIDASGSIYYKDGGITSTYDQSHSDAALAFTQNVVAPFTYTPLDQTQSRTLEGREEAARRNAQQARSSVAMDAFATAMSDRQPGSDAKLAEWGKGMSEKMSGYVGANYPNGISHHDWLELYSRGFLLNPDVMLSSDTSTQSAIKDLKNMEAVKLYQGWEMIQHLEKISVTLATQLAILNEGTRTDVVRK